MKNTILILLTFFLTLSLFSCTTPPETAPISEVTIEPEYADESPLDFFLATLGNGLYRVDLDEGVLIPACPDPLCKHKDNTCPFTKVWQHDTKGDILYYTRYNADQRCVYKICSYDFSTDEYRLLYEVDKNENISTFHVSDKYLYFNVISGLLGASENQKIRLMRCDLESGEAEVLDSNLLDYTRVLCEENGRLYWYNGIEFFSTDLDYKDKREGERGFHHGYVTGGYAIEIVNTGEIIGSSGAAFPEKRVIKYNLKTGEKSVFLESTGNAPMLYNGKVIYTRDIEPVLIGKIYDSYSGKEQKIYAQFGCKLYICNIDGSEDRLLCDFTGSNCKLHFSGMAGIYPGKGDYVVYHVWYYEPVKGNPEYIRRGDDRLLVINIVTGEYKILSAE